jgi:SAM-dependent methyltransferase
MFSGAYLKLLLNSVISDPLQFATRINFFCPICSYAGHFLSFGKPPQRYAICPRCFSLERDRLYAYFLEDRHDPVAGKDVVHFAPEPALYKLITEDYQPASCVTADPTPGVAELQEDMTALSLKNNSLDIIIANHVLEHIAEDKAAMAESYRVLRDGGQFWVTVPIIESWERTYETPTVTTPEERERHYGRYDHVRVYGRDLVTRLEAAGFTVQRYSASPAACCESGISYGETIFVAVK